ncbi:MAG: MFS transporter [Puniceicoccaceae bacterium]
MKHPNPVRGNPDQPTVEKKARQHHVTKDRDRVPFIQKLSIGIGEMPSFGRQGIENLALPIYNIVLGVNPLLVTIVMSLTRLLDAITDPIAGSISDNTRSRWGRRKPYLFVSIFLCGLLFPLIWLVPEGWSEMAYFYYFLATALLFYTAYSFYNVPLMALALEVTPDYHERTRVIAFKNVFVQLMTIFSVWLFAFTQLDNFENTMQGARCSGLLIGGIVLLSGIIPIVFVREGFREVALKKKGLPFFAGVRETLTTKPFLIICLVALFTGLPGVLSQTMGLYVMIYYVFDGNLKEAAILNGVAGTVQQVTTILAIPFAAWLSVRIGKVHALKLCLGFVFLGEISKWFFYSPDFPYLAIGTAVLLGPGSTALYTLVGSMIADVCDYDELKTGRRREGMYGSIYSWISKAIGSIATVLTGIILVIVGFDAAKTGHQDPESITYMRVSFSLIPTIGVIFAFFVLKLYDLNEDRAYEIRQELENRRGSDYVE